MSVTVTESINTVVETSSNTTTVIIAESGSSGGGVSDHGLLAGLGDDDHTQYHTDARGDARYYTKSEIDGVSSIFSGLSSGDVATTLDTASDVTSYLFSIGANEIWAFEFSLFTGCNGTGGVKFGLTTPSGTSGFAKIIGSTSGFNTIASQNMNIDGTLVAVPFNTVSSTGGWVKIYGSVQCGVTPGSVQLRFASGVAGQTSTVFRYSIINANKVS